jgi:hypothetical protein
MAADGELEASAGAVGSLYIMVGAPGAVIEVLRVDAFTSPGDAAS